MAKNKREVEKTCKEELIEKGGDLIRENSTSCLLLATTGDGRLYHSVSVPKSMEKNAMDAMARYKDLLISTLVFNQKSDNPKYEKTITQGKLNLAYFIALDILGGLIELGAEDIAGVESHIHIDSDYSEWVGEEDIIEARKSEEVIADPEEEYLEDKRISELMEEIGDKTIFTLTDEDAEKLCELVSKVTGLPQSAVAKALKESVVEPLSKGKEEEVVKNGRIVVEKHKLSATQKRKLLSVLKEIEKGDE